jgi:hypothetical protein
MEFRRQLRLFNETFSVNFWGVTSAKTTYEILTLYPLSRAKGLVWLEPRRYCGLVKHTNYLSDMSSEMESGKSCSSAVESWEYAPTQSQPQRMNLSQINEATAPKTVPQGGVKDCCG